jgi:hypothetical protein
MLQDIDTEIEILVETIRFVVTFRMLEQPDDPSLANNYFATLLRYNPPTTNIINMTYEMSDENDMSGRAKHYPIVLDFLRRRVENPREAPLHVTPLINYEHVSELVNLENYLLLAFVQDEYLPPGPSSETVYVATPPPQPMHAIFDTFIGKRQDLYRRSMCVDPAYVRLVLQVQPYNAATDSNELSPHAAQILQQPHAIAILDKYQMTPQDIIESRLRVLGSCEQVDFVNERVLRSWVMRLQRHGTTFIV